MCQNVVQLPLEAFEVGAEAKSPHGSSNELNKSEVFCSVFAVELEETGVCWIGEGAEIVRSPSRSMLEDTEGGLFAGFVVPKKWIISWYIWFDTLLSILMPSLHKV